MEITIPYYEDNSRISRSSINWFLISPSYFKAMMDRTIEEATSSSMENGIMSHMYILQSEEFNKTYKVLDFEVPASAQQKLFCEKYIESELDKPILRASEAFKSVYSTKLKSEDKIASEGLEMALKFKSYIKWLRYKSNSTKSITWATLNSLKLTKESIILHKMANELIYKEPSESEEVMNEFHINWEYIHEDGSITPCKSLIDRIKIDEKNKKLTLIDLKTTVSVSNFAKSFIEYGYGMQMAFYWMAIEWYMKNVRKIDTSDWIHETYIVAVENTRKECKVFCVSESTLSKNLDTIQNTLKEINWHYKNGLWDYSRAYYEGNGVEKLEYEGEII